MDMRVGAYAELPNRVVNSLQAENLRLKNDNDAMRWLIERLIEADFGFDGIGDVYNKYFDEEEVVGMSFIDGLIYMARRALEDGYR